MANTAAAILQARVERRQCRRRPLHRQPIAWPLGTHLLNPTQARAGRAGGRLRRSRQGRRSIQRSRSACADEQGLRQGIQSGESLGEIDSTTGPEPPTRRKSPNFGRTIAAEWARLPACMISRSSYIAQKNHNTEIENARLFALLDCAGGCRHRSVEREVRSRFLAAYDRDPTWQ